MATPDVSVSQKIARYALICALMLLGGWMLQHFLPALCWAVVLAIGTSKLYDRWLAQLQRQAPGYLGRVDVYPHRWIRPDRDR